MINEDNVAVELSGISHITPEFIKSLETQLIVRKTLLEDSIKEYQINNEKISNENRTKCLKLKLMKKNLSCGKKRIDELKRNLQGLKQSSKELSEHNSMLKTYIEIYEKESIDIVECQEKLLKKSYDIWQIYKEKYEKIPLAMKLRNDEIDFEKKRIELMIKRYKLSEKIKMIYKRITIYNKQRNLLILESAEYWKIAEYEEKKILEALDIKKKIRIEIEKQETMIKILMEEKRNEMIKAQDKFAAKKIDRKNLTKNFITPSFQRLEIPRLAMTQPPVMFNWWKNDSDNVSICSTLIDELIVESSSPTSDSVLEIEKSNHTNDTIMNDERSVDAVTKTGRYKINDSDNNSVMKKLEILKKNDKIFIDDKETYDVISSDIEKLKEKCIDKIERKEEEEKGGGEKENIIRKSKDSNNNNNNNNLEKESLNFDNNNLSDVYNKLMLTEKKLNDDDKNETKLYPTIRSIETVEFNLPLKKISAGYTAKFIDQRESINNKEDFLGTEFNWKRENCTDSLYTFGDSRKDAEFDSILGSQTSMQSEEMMKRFRLALGSPEFCDNIKDQDSISVNENQRTGINSSQLIKDGFLNNRESTTEPPSPFINIGNIGSSTTPSNRNRTDDRFFLNMF